jgi:hypothetical protein
MHEAPSGAIFQIEDNSDDDDSVAAPPLDGVCLGGEQNAPFHSSEQTQSLLHTTELAVGTAGCCGAACFAFGCLCCGLCRDELVDTHNRFTLCGKWWPL